MVTAIAVASIGLAACGSSSTSSSSSTTGSSSATTAASSGTSGSSSTTAASSSGTSGSSSGSSQLTKWESAVTSYDIPTTPLKDISKLKGKTVYYIPGSQQVPEYAITGDAFKAAMATAGVNVEFCNGDFNPSSTSACVQQATSAGAAGIVVDGFPYQAVADSLDTAKSKGIPVIISDQVVYPSLESTDKVDYLLGASATMGEAVVDWIAQDSAGKGQILINEDTDAPSTLAWIQQYALPQLKSVCSGCSYVINKISTANSSLVPSSTSSALVAHPDTKYVYSEFDSFLQGTQSGVQQAGYTDKVKGVSTTALLSGLQELKSKDYLYADAGDDFPYQGWATADELFRMMLGMPTPTETIPMRLFTRDNVGSLSLTETAQDNGAWFGPTDFPAEFEKVWGTH